MTKGVEEASQGQKQQPKQTSFADMAAQAGSSTKDSMFSMFGGGPKKEKRVVEDDDADEPSGSSKKKGGEVS